MFWCNFEHKKFLSREIPSYNFIFVKHKKKNSSVNWKTPPKKFWFHFFFNTSYLKIIKNLYFYIDFEVLKSLKGFENSKKAYEREDFKTSNLHMQKIKKKTIFWSFQISLKLWKFENKRKAYEREDLFFCFSLNTQIDPIWNFKSFKKNFWSF